MGTAYKEVTDSEVGQSTPKINFSWFAEAWRLFKEDVGTWVAAAVICVFAPLVFDGFIAIVYRITNHLPGLPPLGKMTPPPVGLMLGIGILNAIYVAFIASGVGNMAMKKMAGKPLSSTDLFSGASHFGPMLVWYVLTSIILSTGLSVLIIPGILLGALLLPSFAMVADGVPVFDAFSRSARAMQKERAGAMVLVFTLFLMMIFSSLFAGIGFLVTVPMAALLSALAYRDVIGIPSLAAEQARENTVDIDLITNVNKIPGGPRFSLAGEPLDEDGNVINPKP